jgi:hypothetical protein
MSKRGVFIFISLQIFFVVFGLSLFFGLKSFREHQLENREKVVMLEKVGEEEAPPCSFEGMTGTSLDESTWKETGRPYRILPPGSMMTMDHNPQRINVHIDDHGKITNITCG